MSSVQVDLENCYFPPSKIALVVRLVNEVQSLHSKVSFKDVIQTYLLAVDRHGILNTSRRYWGGDKGWKGTLIVLLAIRKLAYRTRKGKLQWNEFILSEAKRIVDLQASRRWQATHYPEHVPAKSVTPLFFGGGESQMRLNQIKSGMSFLWELIRHRLSTGRPGTEPDPFVSVIPKENMESAANSTDNPDTDNTDSTNNQKEEGVKDKADSHPCLGTTDDVPADNSSSSTSSSAKEEDSGGEEGEDGESDAMVEKSDEPESDDEFETNSDLDMMNDVEGVAYVKRGTTCDQAKSRFDHVASTICSMIAFANNRSVNGLQLENSIAFLAGGEN
ncbi:uncharacterized protein MELLADRAFT_84785 [Melampsora larici-populina 98AG31]|uniref:Uncharacterized protein n=1 Tax=Melampsora larici-populina (strain 98AG31 / pathotype 3-4-7) TaxID=747676 RepID=F4RGP9_MELLP|nr:uncharacterized protein MELLADRAFT_84785 [Melampsora larici-populina 98AG31]EGG08586.1 hypothetical protein MELLADRAFT_84785 [Melampsora larici-populina 98AG31]